MTQGYGARVIAQDLDNIDTYETKHGKTVYRVRLRTRNGKRRSRSFHDLTEAQNFRDRQRIERRNADEAGKNLSSLPSKRVRRKSVVRFIGEDWWPVYEQRTSNERTVNDHRRAFGRLVVGSPLGRTAYDAVTTERIVLWQDWAREQGHSDEMIRKAQKVLSAAYRWGKQRGETFGLDRNPVQGAPWPEATAAGSAYIADPVDVERVRQYIADGQENGRAKPLTRQRDALLYSVMQQTGARPGDVRHLQVFQIDRKNEELHLAKTKGNRPRDVPLLAPLAADLEAYIEAADLGPTSYLFGRSHTKEMTFASWENWRDYAFKPARDLAKDMVEDRQRPRFKTARAYDLCRHSFAALAIASLWDPATLADTMGHSLETLDRWYRGRLRRVRTRRFQPLDVEDEISNARRAIAKEIGEARERDELPELRPRDTSSEVEADWGRRIR